MSNHSQRIHERKHARIRKKQRIRFELCPSEPHVHCEGCGAVVVYAVSERCVVDQGLHDDEVDRAVGFCFAEGFCLCTLVCGCSFIGSVRS